jgi:hypothetical protein
MARVAVSVTECNSPWRMRMAWCCFWLGARLVGVRLGKPVIECETKAEAL